MGALGRPARSLPPWCQTKLVCQSEVGCFRPPQCSLRNEGGAEMADLTIITMSSATGAASRRNADVLPVRSIAG
jgi:hypothetical protein